MRWEKRWEIAGFCLVSWLAIIMAGMVLVTTGIMLFGITACKEEVTTEYISEEQWEDLIFIK